MAVTISISQFGDGPTFSRPVGGAALPSAATTNLVVPRTETSLGRFCRIFSLLPLCSTLLLISTIHLQALRGYA